MIDHNGTENIVCPHCGYERDSTNYRCDGYMEGTEVCARCENEFTYKANINVTWNTRKIIEIDG